MKWIRSFKLFRENIDTNEIDIEDTDTTELRAAKAITNDFKNYVEEFKQKKPQLDTLFAKDIEKSELDKEVDRILGDPDEDARNPFLSAYIQIANDEKRLENLMDDITNDKKNIEENRSLLSDASDEQKDSLEETIKSTQKRVSETQASIQILQRDIAENKRKFEDEMKDKEDKMLNNIKNIEDTRK